MLNRARGAWASLWVADLAWDVRYALRTCRRSPGFTAVAVVMLAVGIGINVTVFTLADAALFRGFPLVVDNGRLVYIANGYGCCVSYPDFVDWRAQARSFDDMAVVHGIRVSVSDSADFAENDDATEVSANIFRLVGQHPFLGRGFVHSDEVSGAAPVAILSYGFWQRRYGKDPAIVGRLVRINGASTTIVGVMPEGFLFPQRQDLWVPLVPTTGVQRREVRNLWVAVGRLTAGATLQTARAEMDTIARRLAEAYPRADGRPFPIVQTFSEFFIGPNAAMVYGALWGAVGLVLLIACANLANLALARATGRAREISVRIALGAGRWRIVRQLLVESVLLSASGGALGWGIGRWGVRAYSAADRLWRVEDLAMDGRVFAYLAVVSVGAGLLVGILPALRLSAPDLNATLKDGGSGAVGGGGRRASNFLVAAEMALAVVLLCGAGVMIRSVLVVYTAGVGIDTRHMVTMEVSPPAARYPTASGRSAFFEELARRIEAIPGVEAVAVADRIPRSAPAKRGYELAGAAPVDPQSRPTVSTVTIGPDYFHAFGTRVRFGREYTGADRASSVPVAIVNEQFAAAAWPGEDAIGRRLRVFSGEAAGPWLMVVGVAPNIDQSRSMLQQFDPIVYLPQAQNAVPGMWVCARTNLPPASLEGPFRRAVQALDPDLPMGYLWTLSDWMRWPYADQAHLTLLFTVFAAVALLLATIGLYSVTAYAVSLRTREIGVRVAIGASRSDILALVLAAAARPLGLGLTIGLAASFAVTPLLKPELVRTSPADPLALASALTVLITAAVVGCAVPARRALRLDPVVALRHE